MTAQFIERAYLSRDDMERIRSLIVHALQSRYVSWCPTAVRFEDGARWITGSTAGRIGTGIDFTNLWLTLNKVRRQRLLDWALGVSPYGMMEYGHQTQLREDCLRIRSFAISGGYGPLIGVTSRIG